MTPLAYQIAKELTLPLKHRDFNDNAGLLARMGDIHCFEISDALPLTEELAQHISRGKIDERTSFLPAPKTWIECHPRKDSWFAWFLEEVPGDPSIATVCTVLNSPDVEMFGSVANGRIRLGATKQEAYVDEIAGVESADLLLASIAVINTPRVIGRQTHAPNRWLERRLLSLRGIIGKFPLHAWTEIQLKITEPADTASGVEEVHYTGEKALHFCRSHLRVRFGRVEIVRSHWRGDASLGIKQSRYHVSGGHK